MDAAAEDNGAGSGQAGPGGADDDNVVGVIGNRIGVPHGATPPTPA